MKTLQSIRYEYWFQTEGNESIEETIENGTYICMVRRRINYRYPYLLNMGTWILGEYQYKTIAVQSGQITTVDFMFQDKISNATEIQE